MPRIDLAQGILRLMLDGVLPEGEGIVKGGQSPSGDHAEENCQRDGGRGTGDHQWSRFREQPIKSDHHGRHKERQRQIHPSLGRDLGEDGDHQGWPQNQQRRGTTKPAGRFFHNATLTAKTSTAVANTQGQASASVFKYGVSY